MHRTTIPPGATPTCEALFRSETGEADGYFYSPQLLALVVRGAAVEQMVEIYIRTYHAFVDQAPAKVDIFHDWSAVTSFSSETRTRFSNWTMERRAYNRLACRGVHLLVTSPMIYLALEAVSAFTRGYMHVYRDRQTFVLERDHAHRSPSHEPIRVVPA